MSCMRRVLFSTLTKEDIEDGDTGLGRFCHVCGWKYDLNQYEKPFIDGINGESISQLENEFRKHRREKPDYNFLIQHKNPHIYICPVCLKHYFSDIGSHEICPICKWQDDLYQEDNPESDGGANHVSLVEARENYSKEGISDPDIL